MFEPICSQLMFEPLCSQLLCLWSQYAPNSCVGLYVPVFICWAKAPRLFEKKSSFMCKWRADTLSEKSQGYASPSPRKLEWEKPSIPVPVCRVTLSEKNQGSKSRHREPWVRKAKAKRVTVLWWDSKKKFLYPQVYVFTSFDVMQVFPKLISKKFKNVLKDVIP